MGAEPLRELFVKILPVTLMLSAMQFLLYELVKGVVSSLICQFICSISMAYLAGVFYPSNFFPETMRILGQLLPVGTAMRYIQGGILGELSLKTVLPVFLYLFLFLGLSVMARDLRLEKGRRR